jgi:hypothetical protein
LSRALVDHERSYLMSAQPVTPTRRVQRLSSAVACADGVSMAELSRGHLALPPQGEGDRMRAGE